MSEVVQPQEDKFLIRFKEEGKRQALKARAALNRRSLNSEILLLIDLGLKAEMKNAPGGESPEALDAK